MYHFVQQKTSPISSTERLPFMHFWCYLKLLTTNAIHLSSATQDTISSLNVLFRKERCISHPSILHLQNSSIAQRIMKRIFAIFGNLRGKNSIWTVFCESSIASQNVSVASCNPKLVIHFAAAAFFVLKEQ